MSAVPGGRDRTLELVDLRGTYTVDRAAGPVQGPNWTGQFQLRLLGPRHAVLFRLNLPSQVFSRFTRRFTFAFADYNGDGHPDVAVGQYLSSNFSGYGIFTIDANRIRALPVAHGLVLGPPNAGYSPAFAMANGHAFHTTIYNNATQQWIKETYTWNGREFAVRSTPVQP